MFAELRRNWKTTNMGIERLLKEIKQSFPSFTGLSEAETVQTMSTLYALWQAHTAAGGSSPFVERREDLESAGLPLARFRRTAGREDVVR